LCEPAARRAAVRSSTRRVSSGPWNGSPRSGGFYLADGRTPNPSLTADHRRAQLLIRSELPTVNLKHLIAAMNPCPCKWELQAARD
jgi:hypothetical protein